MESEQGRMNGYSESFNPAGRNIVSETEDEIDILELLQVISQKFSSIIAISILTGILVFLASTFLLKPKYQSYVDIYVTNTTTQDEEKDSVNANDIAASQKLVTTYKVILQTDDVVSKVIKVAGINEYGIKSILSMVSFSSVENTEILRLTVTSPDPYLSAKICNGYASIAPDVLRDVIKGGSVKILSQAKPDGHAVSPNVMLYTLAGFIGGFAVAAFAYIILNNFSNLVKGEDELEQKCDVSVLGTVPDFFSLKELHIPRSVRNANKKILAEESTNTKLLTEFTILNDKSPFVVTEAYNMIRANLSFATATTKKKIIIISSSLPNECKSTTAVNIAISIANSGSKVLLIDGDLRSPTLHRIFKKSNKKGFSRVLAGFDFFEDSVISDVRPGVDLLVSGPIPPNPLNLIDSENMRSIASVCGSMYDYIIIDTPPINVVADAMLISKYAAGIVMVVREGKTKYNDINKALTKVETTKCNLLGVIITDSERKSGGYGDYRYGYGYGQSASVKQA